MESVPVEGGPPVREMKKIPNVMTRSQSASPNPKTRPYHHLHTVKKPISSQRSQSLSPTKKKSKALMESQSEQPKITKPLNADQFPDISSNITQSAATKIYRILNTKKRDFNKAKKILIAQQKAVMEQYASIRELECRLGAKPDESVGTMKVVSVTQWPAHDLMMLLRDDVPEPPADLQIDSVIGVQVLQHIKAQLGTIPEEMHRVSSHFLARYLDILNHLRQNRADRTGYTCNFEWGFVSVLEQETEQFHEMVTSANENLKTKTGYIYDLAKKSWIDRDDLIKNMEKYYKEATLLKNKMACERLKKLTESSTPAPKVSTSVIIEEVQKERCTREVKESSASMPAEGGGAGAELRAARVKLAALERQFKESRAELAAAKKKIKDFETHTSYRPSEIPSTDCKVLAKKAKAPGRAEPGGRDPAASDEQVSLELKVQKLRTQLEEMERQAEIQNESLRARTEALKVEIAEKQKVIQAAELRGAELEVRNKMLEKQFQRIKQSTSSLLEAENKRCIDLIPTREVEPTDREAELYRELQVTRSALSRTEEELRKIRNEKDNFLDSMSRIAQEGESGSIEDKMSHVLLEKERKISALQKLVAELQENEKVMEQSMTQYENQLADLRLEIKRLRNYECYTKEDPYEELEAESLELQMQLKRVSGERAALEATATARALQLERHERSAELYARVLRARRQLAAMLHPRDTAAVAQPEVPYAEVSRSLTALCVSAADTWSLLHEQQARAARLERTVLEQRAQLEREGRLRTQLEERRAYLERCLAQPALPAQTPPSMHRISTVFRKN